MKKGKENRIKELVNNYKKWDEKDDKSIKPISCIARDNKRKIKKIFEKEMHEPIEKYLIRKD